MNTTINSEGQTGHYSTTKKRKLRQPRVAQACEFCRRRKVKCSGYHPCDYCVKEEVDCAFEGGQIPPAPAQVLTPSTRERLQEGQISSPIVNTDGYDTPRDLSSARPSRRSSLEPPQTFVGGQHVGPTSGVSFLYHHINGLPGEQADANTRTTISSIPLAMYGDYPQNESAIHEWNSFPKVEEALLLLERYFRFATPTYRFLHRPSLEEWTTRAGVDSGLSTGKSACVLLACAQALLYSDKEVRNPERSKVFYEYAKTLLGNEPGPATLASVQARLALCLYLLSTSRINECRFCFSFTIEVITSLGLQRKISTSKRMSLVERESRKRTFWCAYVLDGYLSVMLGRPRLLHDEDIDQTFPINLDDEDMLSAEEAEELPQHGNLEAFIAHVELAKIMNKNSDYLYPLSSLGEEEILVRTYEMIQALDDWKSSLPDFLKPREKTLTGQRTFERQNTVLKLAYAHLKILVTRRCLLTDFQRFGRASTVHRTDSRTLKPIQECISGIRTIIGAAYALMEEDALYSNFWFTQYISLVAISTLYVLLIQRARNTLPVPVETFSDAGEYFEKAKQCQSYLASVAPDGSQSKRHHKLLDHLKAIVEKDLAKAQRRTSNQLQRPNAASNRMSLTVGSTDKDRSIYGPVSDSQQQGTFNSLSLGFTNPTAQTVQSNRDLPNPSHQTANSSSIAYTPSDIDLNFSEILDWGWENLDTLGFPSNVDFTD